MGFSFMLSQFAQALRELLGTVLQLPKIMGKSVPKIYGRVHQMPTGRLVNSGRAHYASKQSEENTELRFANKPGRNWCVPLIEAKSVEMGS